jgi:hypothetical protein
LPDCVLHDELEPAFSNVRPRMLLHPLSLSSSPPPLSRLRSIQAIGISIWASSQSSGDPDQDQIRLGSGITLAGLAIQLIAFIAFTLLVIWAHRHPRCDAAPACPRLPCGTLAHELRQSSRPNCCLACAQLNLPFNLRVCARSRAPPSPTTPAHTTATPHPHPFAPHCRSNGLTGKRDTKRLFLGLYLGMAGLYVRNIFRFAEFVQATVLTWPAPEGAYVLSEQQVRNSWRGYLGAGGSCCSWHLFPHISLDP